MSLAKLEEIKCPCGEIFEAELWNAINAAEDPELKEALLAGEVNVVCCPSCGQIFYAEHFVLYQDATNELLAFVYPSSFAQQADHWKARMEADFARAMEEMIPEERPCYRPILLFGLDALVDIVRDEDEASDEVLILEYLAAELNLSLIYLHQSLARLNHLPRLLPRAHVKDGGQRGEIIAGLHKLLHRNQHLERYRKLLETVEHDKKWTLDKQLIKKDSGK